MNLFNLKNNITLKDYIKKSLKYNIIKNFIF